MALPVKERKIYAKPQVRKHPALNELRERWKSVRGAIAPMKEHLKDYKIALGGAAERIRTYDPSAGSLESAVAKFRNIEKDFLPIIEEAHSVLYGIEGNHEVLAGIYREIASHPNATQMLAGNVRLQMRNLEEERAESADMIASVERLRAALMRKRGLLMDREAKRR